MTSSQPPAHPSKDDQSRRIFFLLHILSFILGSVEALLLARLVLQLLAARPDNPTFAVLLTITAPIIAPLAFLDAQQPRFGAVLEFSTLALSLLTMIGILIGAVVARNRRARSLAQKASS